jgi:hypothetical protein
VPSRLVLVALFLACGSKTPVEPTHLSAQQHLSEARRCEVEASEHEAMIRDESGVGPGDAVCTDALIADQSTSGGERLEIRRPCWSAVVADNERHRRAAQRLRKEAAEHREAAAGLFETEKQACTGLGENEIAASPFYYAADIVKVEELREGDTLKGARVLFRRVPGLDAEYLRKSVSCHQARAAVMGFDTSFQSYDPLALPDVASQVTEGEDGFWVALRSDREGIPEAVLGRARDCSR